MTDTFWRQQLEELAGPEDGELFDVRDDVERGRSRMLRRRASVAASARQGAPGPAGNGPSAVPTFQEPEITVEPSPTAVDAPTPTTAFTATRWASRSASRWAGRTRGSPARGWSRWLVDPLFGNNTRTPVAQLDVTKADVYRFVQDDRLDLPG